MVCALVLMIFGFFAPASQAGQPFDYEALRSLIKGQNVSRIEDLLAKLPDPFLENYILMYASREDPSQAATPFKPRAFLYGDGESGLVISFSGDPRKSGYDSLEVSQFDAKSEKVDFMKISFKNGQAVFEDGIDHPKPASCLRCHMQSRPIWEEIASAPGAYGGRKAGLVGSERENFATFVRENGQNGRYGHLKGLDEKGEAYVARKPAEQMARIMRGQNQQRLARMIRELPGYETYRFEIAAAFSGVEVEDRIGGDFQGLLADTKRLLQSWHDANVRISMRQTGVSQKEAEYAMPDLNQEKIIARLRLIIEGKMGVNMENWSTTFKVDSFTEIGLDRVFENLQRLDPSLKNLVPGCDKLLKRQ